MNWDILINGGFGIVGTLVGAFFARRKQAAEAASVEVANAKEVLGMWKSTAEHLQAEITSLKAEIAGLHSEVDMLRRENAELRSKLREPNA